MTELETPRLRLRLWREDDLETVVRWNADPFVMRHMGRPPMTREETEEAMARTQRHWDEHGFGVWAAELRQTGELVGRIGVAYHRVWPDDPEVGWLIDTPYTGQGLATEGGAACVEYGFGALDRHRLVSICTEGNVESRRVMAKLEFREHTRIDFAPLGIELLVHARDAESAA